MCLSSSICFIFFTDPAPTEIYTLSLHDALPISAPPTRSRCRRPRPPSLCAAAPSRARLLRHARDRKSTRLNSSHPSISYAVFCLKKKTTHNDTPNTHLSTSRSLTSYFYLPLFLH